MGETPRTYSSLSTLYYVGHKPTFRGEGEQIKNIRERERQGTAERLVHILCNFFSVKTYEEVMLMPVIRQDTFQINCRVSRCLHLLD